MAFAEFMPGASVVGISYNDGVILAARQKSFIRELRGKQEY